MDLVCCYTRRRDSGKDVRAPRSGARKAHEDGRSSRSSVKTADEDGSALVIVRVLGAALAAGPSHGDLSSAQLGVEVEWQAGDGSLRRIGRTLPQHVGQSRKLEWRHACPGQPYSRSRPRPPELSPRRPTASGPGLGERVRLHLLTDCPGGLGRDSLIGSASIAVEELLGPTVEASSGGGKGPAQQLELLPSDSRRGVVGTVTVQATLLFAEPCGAAAARRGGAQFSGSADRTSLARARSPSSSSSGGEAETPASIVAASMLRHWTSGREEQRRQRMASEEEAPASAAAPPGAPEPATTQAAPASVPTVAAPAHGPLAALRGQQDCSELPTPLLAGAEFSPKTLEDNEPKDQDSSWLNNGLPDVCNVPCFRGDPILCSHAE